MPFLPKEVVVTEDPEILKELDGISKKMSDIAVKKIAKETIHGTETLFFASNA
jgi:hypothetical protein